MVITGALSRSRTNMDFSILQGGKDMKVKYSKDVDILMVWLSDESFDYAKEANGVITHFSADGRPVLLEIQGAKGFLLSSLTSMIKEEEVSLP